MRIAVVAVRHPVGRTSPVVPAMVERLRGLGHRVTVLAPDERRTELGRGRDAHDLYVLKSGSETALSLAGAWHSQGARIVNPYPVAAACRDKVVQTQVLLDAGLPVPRTWATAAPLSLVPLLHQGPLILKDPRGSQGAGIAVVRSAEDLEALSAGRSWLAMRYHQPDGWDLKLYRIGDDVFGVERPFPARSYAEKLGRPFPVGPELVDLVRRCGEAFGITLYGVDVIRSGGQLWVVDMSSFPGFKGVPDAGPRLAEYLVEEGLAVAERAGGGTAA